MHHYLPSLKLELQKMFNLKTMAKRLVKTGLRLFFSFVQIVKSVLFLKSELY